MYSTTFEGLSFLSKIRETDFLGNFVSETIKRRVERLEELHRRSTESFFETHLSERADGSGPPKQAFSRGRGDGHLLFSYSPASIHPLFPSRKLASEARPFTGPNPCAFRKSFLSFAGAVLPDARRPAYESFRSRNSPENPSPVSST